MNRYPYTDMHEMNLDWILLKVKEMISEWDTTKNAWNELHEFVDNYFENLDVQQEINNKLDEMAAGGELADLMAPYVTEQLPSVVGDQIAEVVALQIGAVVAAQLPGVVSDQIAGAAAAWLEANVDPDTGYVIDDSLTIANAAADAKITGEIRTSLIGARYGALDGAVTSGYYDFTRGSIDPSTGEDDDTGTNRGRTDFIEVPDGTTCVRIAKSTASYYTRMFAYDKDQNYIGRFYDAPNNTKYVRLWCQPKPDVSIDVDDMHDEVQVTFIRSNVLSSWTFGTPVNNFIVETESVTTSVYSDYVFLPKGTKLIVEPVGSCTVGYYKYTSDHSVFLQYAYKTNDRFVIEGDDCSYRLHMTDPFDSPYVTANVGGYANARLELLSESGSKLKTWINTETPARISNDDNLIAHVPSLAFKGTKAYAAYYANDDDQTEPSVLGSEYLVVSEFYPDDPQNRQIHVILKKGDAIGGETVRGNVREPVIYATGLDDDTIYVYAEAGTGVSDVDYFLIEIDVSDWSQTITKCTLDGDSFGVTTLGRIVESDGYYYAGLGGYTEHFPATLIRSDDMTTWTTIEQISDAFIYEAGTTEAETEYCKEVNVEIKDDVLYVAYGVNRTKEAGNPRTDSSYRGAYYATYDLLAGTASESSQFLAQDDTCSSFRPMVFKDNRNVYAAVLRSKHYWYYDALKNSTRPRSCMGFFVWNGSEFEFFDSVIDKNAMHYIFPIPFLFQLYAVFSSDPRNVNWQKSRSGIYFSQLNLDTYDKPYILNTQEPA